MDDECHFQILYSILSEHIQSRFHFMLFLRTRLFFTFKGRYVHPYEKIDLFGINYINKIQVIVTYIL